MRCSICDSKKNIQFIFQHWHCGKCIEVIKDTIGHQRDDEQVESLEEYLEELKTEV